MNWLNIKKIGGFNVVELSLLFAVITMPLSNNLNSYCIVAFSIAAFFSNSAKEKKELLSRNKIWVLPVGYYLLMILSMAWDSGSNKSLHFLENSASLAAFPLLLGSINPLSKTFVKRALFCFVAVNVVAAVYCLWNAYVDYKTINYINVFFYHHLSMQIDLNAIYFSLYTVFSILVLFYYGYLKNENRWAKLIALTTAFFLIIFTVLLASKMLLFLLCLTVFSVIVYSFFHYKKRRGSILIFSAFLVLIPITLLQFPYIKSRITETKLLEYRSAADNFNGLAVRGLLWKSTWELIREKPILGYGHYGAQDELRLKYAKAGFEEGVKEDFNSHNQYLYTWVNYGIIGLWLFGMYLFLFIKSAFRHKEYLALLFGLIFSVANLTECMLQIQKGIVFFMLFSSLFLFHLFRPNEANL